MSLVYKITYHIQSPSDSQSGNDVLRPMNDCPGDVWSSCVYDPEALWSLGIVEESIQELHVERVKASMFHNYRRFECFQTDLHNFSVGRITEIEFLSYGVNS